MTTDEIILTILFLLEFIFMIVEFVALSDRITTANEKAKFYEQECNKLEDINFKLSKINNKLIFEKMEDTWEEFYATRGYIIDCIARKYLYNVIKPFKDEVKSIKLYSPTANIYIYIELKNHHVIVLPITNCYASFHRMEENKEYTLEELGLDL